VCCSCRWTHLSSTRSTRTRCETTPPTATQTPTSAESSPPMLASTHCRAAAVGPMLGLVRCACLSLGGRATSERDAAVVSRSVLGDVFQLLANSDVPFFLLARCAGPRYAKSGRIFACIRACGLGLAASAATHSSASRGAAGVRVVCWFILGVQHICMAPAAWLACTLLPLIACDSNRPPYGVCAKTHSARNTREENL